jgi:hypothetical protein
MKRNNRLYKFAKKDISALPDTIKNLNSIKISKNTLPQYKIKKNQKMYTNSLIIEPFYKPISRLIVYET